ncbi:hypothetical protein SPRG_12322 [Saprolegnia parasitica CBS 223.65]|uniref:Uncharacterized protein n=1 Tax=Saprolegnia parasitica (strain CBS 223.65) TaxID=695850 RepID=A0A067C6T6_SAPPC|nr:hypothetical protein SPRG_12322 [Saprolegnia parasitica CBS 223.65]KDO22236.1 hypothetical protein SPRG_12322 [Saprolegnia parasitica CBS 223.65]|eukprot:XP_012207073.1 hypothetical protein SPRG_12322 [Saprolegnia parasitica CBS 223.65]
MSSSDDEAPEQVSMAVAKTQAIESRASEKQARASAKATAALKRKRQPKKKEEPVIEALPDDVLAAVAAAQDEPSADADEEQEEEVVVNPKKTKKTKKNSHTRRFGNIEVTTVAALEEEAAPVTDSIAKFIELRSAPTASARTTARRFSSPL